MKLLDLNFKNLFSLGEGEVDLQDRGLTLITGWSEDESSQNAAGKSTVANKAILWTLFGGTAGGLKADNAINRHGKKKCFGEIFFEGIDNEVYIVRRERPAKLSLFKGDSNISASTAKITQELIDKLLGFNFKTFLQTSVFGQGKTIHYPNLSPREQKEILEQILPMEEVDRWAEYADEQAKKLKPKLNELEKEFRSSETKIEVLANQLSECEKDGIRFEENRQRDIKKAKEQLEKIREQFKTEQDRLEELGQEVTTIAPEKINIEIFKIQTEREKYTSGYEVAKTFWEEASRNGGQWSYKLKTLKEQRDEINTDTKCPVCLRDYDETTIEAVNNRLQKLDEKINEANVKHDQCFEAINYYHQEMKNNEKIINDCNSKIQNSQEQLTKQKEYDQKKQILENRINNTKASTESLLFSAENAENPHKTTFQRIQKELKDARINSKDLEKKYKLSREEMEHLLYWKDVYGKELKLKLFEDACPFLDNRTAYHLNQLRNPQFHCDFSTVKRLASGEAKEEFNVDVWSETGGRGFESLSGGEQQIVNFAIGLSLADLAESVSNSKSNFLILDEPLTELDAKNSESVVEYLMSEIGNGKDSIFLISNEESLKGLIPNRIHVIKSHGISNVVKA